MNLVELTVRGTGTGTCSLTGKECEGVTVTFKDGTTTEAFLSTKAFTQLVRMKAGMARRGTSRCRRWRSRPTAWCDAMTPLAA